MNYETIVGLEIHVELNTQTKMFCKCSVTSLADRPNTRTCPVCLGLPGALPYANRKAVESCIKIALALNCNINLESFFERKNYFYPDLAKGFQISQYLRPFGEKGFLDIMVNGKKKRVRITRVHMEEDTGKLIHALANGEDASLIDFNRSGIPLVEIVTEPDIRSGMEAKELLVQLQRIIKYLGVSDADMEKGQMRLEPNISLRRLGERKLPKYKVEVKNINSFRFVEKAIAFEQRRHEELLEEGEAPVQETRGWNEFKNKTVSQRSKEEAHDYRYFPEPDLPSLKFDREYIDRIKSNLPELPLQKLSRFMNLYELSSYNAELLTREKSLAEYFERVTADSEGKDISPKDIANEIINKKIDTNAILPAELVQLILQSKKTTVVRKTTLKKAIKKVIEENKKAVTEYRAGKEQVLGFLMGMVKRQIPDARNSEQTKAMLIEMLS